MLRNQWTLEEFRDETWKTLSKGSFEELDAELLLRLRVDPDAQIVLYEEQVEEDNYGCEQME